MTTPKQKRLVQERLADIRGANNKWSKFFKWTGLPGKTLWDCLTLSAALAIPLVVVFATIGFGFWQTQLADKQHTNDIQLATDQQQEAMLKTYLDDMTTLLLDKKLGSQIPADKDASAEAAIVARAKTLTALRHLNGQRKATIVQFLYEAHLIGYISCDGCSKPASVISLIDADLTGANLSRAILVDADLTGANLSRAILIEANLIDATLSGADLTGANLSDASLSDATLINACLRHADLIEAKLVDADLSGAVLSRANLSRAILVDADLSGADLTGAKVTQDQLAKTKSLQGAIMPDGSTHP